jgi:hypothetical protein
MYYIGLDVHNMTISYCVKEASGYGMKGCKNHSSKAQAKENWRLYAD